MNMQHVEFQCLKFRNFTNQKSKPPKIGQAVPDYIAPFSSPYLGFQENL